MNIEFIRIIAQTHPALARAIELGIISGTIYLLLALTGGEFTFQGLMLGLLTPLIAALSKYRRDLEKK